MRQRSVTSDPSPAPGAPAGIGYARAGRAPIRTPGLSAAQHLAALRAPERLAAVCRTGLLDSPPEESFDRLTRSARRSLDAPVALISLIDERRQFIKSQHGLGQPWAGRRELPLTHSYCQYTVTERAPLVVTDARRDPVLRASGGATELGAVAYAGVPLITREGYAVGTFCVFGPEPREWTGHDLAQLGELADVAQGEIDLRLSAREPAALPLASGPAPPAARPTVLLVEDEDLVRSLAREVLRRAGFEVIEARSPADAERLVEGGLDRIDLLLTDVVMPGMSGPELARRLARRRPGLRVLYMSGFSEEAIARHGELSPGSLLLEKPFTIAELVARVRQALAR
ncbi:MAG TPA: response regulator [Gemmatimonadales bacterium]|nr:response regulator [Gemmatimonadales bacterium]